AYPRTGYTGGRDKINAAFAYGFQPGGGRAGGFELLALTVKQLTGISFDGGAIVNFAGFQSLVTALGGVDLCVDEKVVSIHTRQVYQPGCQHMAAWQALDYVRQRAGKR